MTPADRLPVKGEIWVGGENGGHPPSRVQILRVATATLTVRFLRGHKPSRARDGERTHLKLAHFLLHFRPA